MIRLLADENVPLRSVALLRRAGFDVAVTVSGASDDGLLARAARERRVVVTQDRDFGKLALARGAAAFPGVVYLRLRSPRPEACGEALLRLLRDLAMVLEGRFTVVRSTRVRQRPVRSRQ